MNSTGEIVVTLRVGTTGHRALRNEHQVRSDIDRAIRHLLDALQTSGWPLERSDPNDPRCGRDDHHPLPKLVAISALAEGADRLIVDQLREYSAHLEVVLPRPAAEYESDFTSAQSQAQFAELLKNARRTVLATDGHDVVDDYPSSVTADNVTVPMLDFEFDEDEPKEQRQREIGYALSGAEIVRQCDLLIAVWDGQRERGVGGTASIVRLARRLGKHIIWISTDATRRITLERGGDAISWDDIQPVDRALLNALDKYNEEIRDFSAFEADAKAFSDTYAPEEADGILDIKRVHDWITPFYARAESQARWYQRWYFLFGATLTVLSFLAVVSVASQEMFKPEHPGYAWPELCALTLALGAYALGRKWRPRDWWMRSRFLAEAFRSATFLAIAGAGNRANLPSLNASTSEPEAWLVRAYAEVWSERPDVDIHESDVGVLRDWLVEHWICPQKLYHRQAARKQERWHRVLGSALYVLFGLAFLFAVLHIWVPARSGRPFPLWSFLSAILPAAGAGVTAVAADREFRRHAERNRRMTLRLSAAEQRMRFAKTVSEIQNLALDIERDIRIESAEWLGAIRLHDLELAP